MTREDILLALEKLNEVLSRKGQSDSLLLVGGAALALTFDQYPWPAGDVDAVHLSPQVSLAAEEIAWDLGLPSDWLNAAAEVGYVPGPGDQVSGPAFSHLQIILPSRMFQLCQRLSASRGKDIGVAQFIIEQMPEVQSDLDWQSGYFRVFGKSDWAGHAAHLLTKGLHAKVS